MPKRACGLLLAPVATVLLASACTSPAPSGPTGSSTSPTPSPTYTCTGATTADPCTAKKAAEEKQQAADYAAAEAAYRSFTAERNRLAISGGTTVATAEMKKYAAGPYLTEITGYLAKEKQNNRRTTSGTKIVGLQPLPGSHRTTSPAGELTLQFCEDGRGSRVLDSSGKVLGSGVLVGGDLYARQISGKWYIWDDNSSQVAACPG